MHRFHIVSLCPDEPSLFFLFVLFNRRRGPGFALKGSRCLHGEEKSRRLPERNALLLLLVGLRVETIDQLGANTRTTGAKRSERTN